MIRQYVEFVAKILVIMLCGAAVVLTGMMTNYPWVVLIGVVILGCALEVRL